MTVNSMVRHAKLNAKLYEEMVELGYSDESFPVWWFSPGREGTEEEVVGEGGTTLEEGGEIAGRRTETEGGGAYPPTPPDTPIPKRGRPVLPVSPVPSSPLRSSPGGSEDVPPSPTSSKFSDLELSVLEDRGISEITPGRWMRTEQQSGGRIMLSPVDPRQELVRLQRSAKGEEIMGAVGENMVNQLTVHTQAIMKKVAFNPNVFQCWQFVSNAVDEDTGDPFIPTDWDLGDYVSHCVAWCTEHEYGIVPTVMYNRPSRYTQLRELRRGIEPQNYVPQEAMPVSSLNLPRTAPLPRRNEQ